MFPSEYLLPNFNQTCYSVAFGSVDLSTAAASIFGDIFLQQLYLVKIQYSLFICLTCIFFMQSCCLWSCNKPSWFWASHCLFYSSIYNTSTDYFSFSYNTSICSSHIWLYAIETFGFRCLCYLGNCVCSVSINLSKKQICCTIFIFFPNIIWTIK